MSKNSTSRERRVRRSRRKILDQNTTFLSVHRTPRHIYAQVFTPRGERVLAQASSVEQTLKGKKEGAGKLDMASAVGKLVAERAKAQGITRVAFDRSGYRYHGRIKALADAARTHGLEF